MQELLPAFAGIDTSQHGSLNNAAALILPRNGLSAFWQLPFGRSCMLLHRFTTLGCSSE